MVTLTCAAIDVGSNAVRFTIGDLQTAKNTGNKQLLRHAFLRLPIRLADYDPNTFIINETKITALLHAFGALQQLMHVFGVLYYKAVATSALRDANNGSSITDKIFKQTGIRLDIINPHTEAMINIKGVLNQINASAGRVVHLDIGGGSTEISVIQDKKLVQSHSFKIGTVRLLKGSVAKEQWQKFSNVIKEVMQSNSIHLFSGSGAIEPIFDLIIIFKKKASANRILYLVDLLALKNMLDSKTTLEITNTFNISVDKAELAGYAADILILFMQAIQSDHIFVTKFSMLDGILMQALDSKITLPQLQ